MRIFPKISKIRAQHSIEYIVLLTLIMAGIIIIGPYVIRSWNANLKGWEDSVIDSLEDPLLEVPPEEVPVGECTADDWDDVGCHLGVTLCNGDTFSCGWREMLFTREYTPNNCECGLEPVPDTAKCEMNNSYDCCEPWDPGRDPGSPRLPTAADCGPPNCPEGEYYRTHICDDGEFEDDCEPDPVCGFSCKGTPYTAGGGFDGYGDFCPGATTGLTNNTTPYTYVEDGNCDPDPDVKCQIECAPGYPVAPGGAYCYPCIDWGLPENGCGPGFYDLQGCNPGYFIPCCTTLPSGTWVDTGAFYTDYTISCPPLLPDCASIIGTVCPNIGENRGCRHNACDGMGNQVMKRLLCN